MRPGRSSFSDFAQALRLSFEGAKPTTPLTAKGAKGTSPEVRGFGLTLPRVLTCASVGHHDRNA